MSPVQTSVDFDAQSESGYLICGSPRSGSTMLCDLLVRTGVAGKPESYFRTQSIPEYAQRWGDRSSRHDDWGGEYLAGVRRSATGANGCLGVRIMWSNMPELLAVLRSLFPNLGTDQDRLRRALGVRHYIHLFREDKGAQAVSLALALQTGLWHRNADGTVRAGSEGGKEPRYDAAIIAEELTMLEAEEHGWTAWFREQSIEPVRLSYESIASDPLAALQLVLSEIDQQADGPLPAIGTAPTSTELNKQWIERFQSEPR